MKNLRRQLFVFLALTVLLVGCTQQSSEEGAEGEGSQPASAPPRAATITIPAGTEIQVSLITGLSSKESQDGQAFQASVENPVVVGDKVAIPKDADVTGHVTKAVPSGRLKGRAELWVTLDSVTVKGRKHNVATSTTGHKEGSKATRDILFIGGGAGAGAAVGGATGGGKGAGIGAAIGAGAGTVAAMLTGKREVEFPPETILQFRLEQDVTVRQ